MHAFFSGLGRFTVKYRWIVLVVWLLGTGIAVKSLPSLASQVTNDNTKFLPSNAPDVKAANLAAVLVGKENSSPIIVVAARPAGTIDAADIAVLQQVGREALALPNVHRVLPVTPSPGRHAALIQVLADVQGFTLDKAKTAVNQMQHLIDSVRAPPGLHLSLAGQTVDAVAQNAASKTTGNQTQGLSVVFILILLFLIFRSLLAPFVTLLPAVVVLALAGSIIGELGAHGLKISEVTQLLLIVLLLGAGTDYGLFLVFRVREGIRDGLEPKAAVSLAVSRVGESIAASAGTVIFALLSLLLASFGIYHDLGIPLAIGIATMLLAGLTLLPALLAILGRAVFWPSIPKAGDRQGGWWGRVAGRIVSRPVPTLVVGLVIFGALAVGAVTYSPSGFGGATKAPAGTAAARGDAQLAAYFPQSSANPTNLIFVYRQSVWQHPGVLLADQGRLERSKLFRKLVGPLDPASSPLSTSELTRLHSELGNPRALPLLPPARVHVPLLAYIAYKAEAQFISSNGHVVQFQGGLAVGDPGGSAALNEVPQLRSIVAATARATGASENGVAGEAPALYDISSTSDGDLIHIIPIAVLAIDPPRARAPQRRGAPLPHRERRVELPRGPRPRLDRLHRDRRRRRAHVPVALPHVHLPAGPRRGLQHPRHDPHPGGGARPHAEGRSRAGRRDVGTDDHLGRPGAGHQLRRAGRRRLEGAGREPGARHRLRARGRHPHGHVPRAHPPRALHRRHPRAVELVAPPRRGGHGLSRQPRRAQP